MNENDGDQFTFFVAFFKHKNVEENKMQLEMWERKRIFPGNILIQWVQTQFQVADHWVYGGGEWERRSEKEETKAGSENFIQSFIKIVNKLGGRMFPFVFCWFLWLERSRKGMAWYEKKMSVFRVEDDGYQMSLIVTGFRTFLPSGRLINNWTRRERKRKKRVPVTLHFSLFW